MGEKRDEALTPDKLSAYLKIPKSAIYKLVWEGKILGQKASRHCRFLKVAIDRWLEETHDGRRKQVMAEHLAGQVLRKISEARELYYYLILVVGPAGSGKSNDVNTVVDKCAPNLSQNTKASQAKIRKYPTPFTRCYSRIKEQVDGFVCLSCEPLLSFCRAKGGSTQAWEPVEPTRLRRRFSYERFARD